MHAVNIDHMFRGLSFTKSATVIKEAAIAKVTKLKVKIEERQARINSLRKEYDIDDAALIQLLTAARKQQNAMQFTYTSSSFGAQGPGGAAGPQGPMGAVEQRVVGAGVVNNLLTENDFIEAERDQIADLERIVRNLKPLPRYATDSGVELPPAEFPLSKEELDYLGF